MVTYPVTLGIDPGLATTGLVVFDARRICTESLSFKSTQSLPESKRIVEIVSQILNRLYQFPTYERPTVAAVEQYVFQGKKRANNGSVFALSRLVGNIEGALRQEGMTVVGYTRGQGLQAIGLPNNASKRAAKLTIQRITKSRGGVLPGNEHTCAAWAQAWAATGARRA